MFLAFSFLMATKRSGDKFPRVHTNRSSLGTPSGDIPRKTGRRGRPLQPNHFLSVRIDNAQIWEKVSTLQRDILASNDRLTGAAIPVQDLHLTLFVLTLHERDGTLQRAKETLEHCGDILLEHSLSSEIRSPLPISEDGGKTGDEKAQAAQEASPLTLSFRDLGIFRDKVLFARLVEDHQAERLRALVSALHRRFHEARLVDAPPRRRSASGGSNISTSKSNGGDRSEDAAGESYRFEFEPHLTIMKTSKLRDRNTILPPASYNRDHHRDFVFGSHSPSSLDLSSMLEREDTPPLDGWETRAYYKCEQQLALRGSTA